MGPGPAARLGAAALLLAAAVLAGACGRPRMDVEQLFTPSRPVQFRTAAGGEWQAGVVATVGRCRALFQPSPPPPRPPSRFTRIDFAELRALRVRTDSSAGWTAVDLAELRRRFGGCIPS